MGVLSPKGDVFATMKAVFWSKTVLGFRPVQELALRHKDGRTECGAKGHSLHEWCFYCFCFHHINFRRLNQFSFIIYHLSSRAKPAILP